MESVLFKVWGNLPSRVIGLAGIFLPAYFAANPEDFNKAVGAVMSPDNIRFWSLVVLGLFLVYWGIYWYLKRRGDGMNDSDGGSDKGAGGSATHGDGSHIFKDVNGNITVNPPSPSKGIENNTFEENGIGILTDRHGVKNIRGNTFRRNGVGVQIGSTGEPDA